MLPYHALQLAYAGCGGLLASLVWWGSGRLLPARAATELRLVLGIALVLGLAVIGYPTLARLLEHQERSGFMAIAWAFYAGCLWLPLLALLGPGRTPRGLVGRALLPLAVLGTGVWALVGEPNRLDVRCERLAVPQWAADSAPVRVVHLSDLQTVGPCEREARVLERVRELRPDLVVFTGDYVAGPHLGDDASIAAARAFVSELASRYTVVAVGGHSETHAARLRILEGTGALYLTNERLELDLGDGRRLEIHGLDPRGPDLVRLDRPPAPGVFRIVASHVPDVSARLSGRDVDLHLAGHTHGGQIAIPGIGAPVILSSVPRALARGLHRFGDHWIDVSAGIGMEGHHAPRLRLFCPPEISLIELAGAARP